MEGTPYRIERLSRHYVFFGLCRGAPFYGTGSIPHLFHQTKGVLASVAGATQEGGEVPVAFCRKPGESDEATILIQGGKIPAENAFLFNRVMARAFHVCDVMKEYYKNPSLTSQTIRDGWLHTGDLGRMDEEGFIYLLLATNK